MEIKQMGSFYVLLNKKGEVVARGSERDMKAQKRLREKDHVHIVVPARIKQRFVRRIEELGISQTEALEAAMIRLAGYDDDRLLGFVGKAAPYNEAD